MFHHQGYPLSDMDNWLPWEREMYISLLLKQLEKDGKQ